MLALDDRKHVAAMLMDLSKAFDSLPHSLSLLTLSQSDVLENLYRAE